VVFQMSQSSKIEYLKMMRERYARRPGKRARGALIDEVCAMCGYERKYAIKVLRGKRRGVAVEGRGGPRRRYEPQEIQRVLKTIWLVAEQPCGKRMVAMMALWLPFYEGEHGALAEAARERLLKISASTIDRLLSPCRARLGARGRCGTRPGTLLRTQIPIRTEHWDVQGPGYLEADTVAHGGNSGAGDFCYSLTLTDIFTQWTETRAIWNRGQHAVLERITEVEAVLPFAILGFDSDNGGEFINWHLYRHFSARPTVVAFTRSRAYRKNDNAHVEQKNWTHVRQLVGYGRLDQPEQAERLNDLYAKEWGWFRNFFCPVMKHLRTEVEGSRKRRIYDRPQTPFERLKKAPGVDPRKLEELEKLKASLNPFRLKEVIERKLRAVLRYQPRPKSRRAAA
jgi:hypothetical protein